jgi:hypothetical protein
VDQESTRKLALQALAIGSITTHQKLKSEMEIGMGIHLKSETLAE